MQSCEVRQYIPGQTVGPLPFVRISRGASPEISSPEIWVQLQTVSTKISSNQMEIRFYTIITKTNRLYTTVSVVGSKVPAKGLNSMVQGQR